METETATTVARPERSSSWPQRILRRLATARYERIEAAIEIARLEIEGRSDPASTGFPRMSDLASMTIDSWKDAALCMLKEAEGALTAGKINEAWTMLHAARRQEIFGLRDSELLAFTTALRAEAEKLKPWRQKAVIDIVGTADKPRDASRSDLIQAAMVRDDHYDNQGHKDQLMRSQIMFLAFLLAVELAAIIGLSSRKLLLSGERPQAPTFYWLVAVMVFGNLGATVSAMLRVANATGSTARIPEITAAYRVTFMRIAMGGASAVLIDLAVRSNVPGVFNTTLKDFIQNINAEGAYVIAFAAGFTERLVIRAVEAVAGKASSDESKPPAKPKPSGETQPA